MFATLRGFGRFALITVAGTLVAGTLGACAGDVADVNLVQPGYVTKSDFLGKTWYYRRTVVDTPETVRGPDGEFGNWVSIGEGDLFTIERLRFKIEEDFMVGYRDYEFVPGGEEREYPGGAADYHGSPVVAFPIASHFDIQYDYNPTTGEETNVLNENDTDRLWNEREYMRVDWNATNVDNNPFVIPVDLVDTDKQLGSDEYVYEDDPASPYRARIHPETGYFDFVTNHYVQPDIYTCYFDFDFSLYDLTSCGGGEIKMRHSFWQVDEEQNAGYESLYYPDTVTLHDDQGNELVDPATAEAMREPIFQRFGFYRLERLTYDNIRDLTESGRLYRIIRFNIWQKSYDADHNLIPYAEREVRPIEYWLNWDFPEELRSTAYEVAAEWNDAFRDVVASLQGRDKSQVPDVYILHDNSCSITGVQNYLANQQSVEEAARAAVNADLTMDTLDNWCAATEYYSEGLADPFTWEQMGDSRYNMMYWITQIVPAPFSGYGPMLGDPTNGRNVVSSAYILGWTIDRAAGRAVEYIDYMNDDLPVFDLLKGANLPNYYYDGNFDPHAAAARDGGIGMAGQQKPSQADLDELSARFARNGQSFDEMMRPVENSQYAAERLSRLAGSGFERENMIRPEDLILASRGHWRPGMQVSEDLWEKASYARRQRDIIAKQKHTARFLEERTMCPLPAAELDPALTGLAKTLEGKSHAEKLLTLRKSYFKAVMLHEVGHNLGLRHNFEGSYDALNYNPTYWDLEAKNGHGTPAAEQAKEEASQSEYKYSSIMDYHGKTNGDFRGLGLYDRAAIKFGYGQLVETFKDSAIPGGNTLRQWRFENDFRDLVEDDLDGNLTPRDHDANGDLVPDAWFPSWPDMYDRQDVTFDWTQPKLTETYVEGITDHEVPYMFCSDEFAGTTPTCKRFDFGANQREVQEAQQIRYKNYFIFSNFRRNRLVLDFYAIANRAYSTFQDTILTYQYLYYYRSRFGKAFANTDLYQDLAVSSAKGLNLMKEVIAMPRPSTYYRCVLNQGQPNEDITYYTSGYLDWDPVVDAYSAIGPDGEECDMSQQVGLGIGQTFPLFFGFSEETIIWSFSYLGVYYDKIAAINMLTSPLAWFPRDDLFEDQPLGGYYSISLYRLFHQEVNDILLGLIEFDRKSLASNVNSVEGQVVPTLTFPGATATGPDLTDGRIVPSLVRNLQINALVDGMVYLTSPYDETLDFSKYTKVVQKGGPDDFFDTVGYTNIAECEMPEAGVTYRAVPTDSASDRNGKTDIAYNFVTKCAGYAAERKLHKAELTAAEATLATLSSGTPEYVLQQRAVNEAQREFDRAEFRLRETEQVLLWMRQLNYLYEYGIGL